MRHSVGLMIMAIVASVGTGPIVSAAWAAPSKPFDITDYLAMDVCLDTHGKVMIGMSPTDARCTTHRNITNDDPVPYYLIVSGPTPACGHRRLLRNNLLWRHDNVVRAVGAVSIEKDACDPTKPLVPAYYSVRWADDAYAFIMGSWTRGADGGKIGGGVTPLCPQKPDSSIRYFQNWALAPATEIHAGQVGHGVFSKKGGFSGLSRPGDACPANYPTRYLALWSRNTFTYGSGATLDTILSHPYSQVDESGTTPGNGRQMERTYWTREFGQSRWESWKRDDYVNKHVGKTAQELAQNFFATTSCTKPFELKGRVTDGMTLGPVEENQGVYSQVLTDTRSGIRHRWVMVGCQDMTSTIPAFSAAGDEAPSMAPVTPVFWDFWK